MLTDSIADLKLLSREVELGFKQRGAKCTALKGHRGIGNFKRTQVLNCQDLIKIFEELNIISK